MRSIHKKTLKRFLSTLLALTMVLGMVPFTALAAPADVTLTKSGLKATITPSVPAVTAGNTSTVTYAVTIEATDTTASGQAVTLTIDGTNYDVGTVTISSSPYYVISNTGIIAPFTTTTDGKITGTVTGGGYAIGSHTVEMSLAVGILGSVTETPTITVPRKANISTLTATPDEVTVGQDFTVKATSDIADGRVQFEYNGESKYVDVESRLSSGDTIGYAECTFTATGTAGTQTVTALQYAMTGVVNSDVMPATITVNAATVYHTITFDGNAVDAYHIPDPVSMEHGSDYNGSAPGPDRTGYTFAGWATTSYAATPNVTDTNLLTVDADITLYAVWAKNTVTVHYPASDLTGANVIPNGDATVPEGSTQTFTVTLAEGYDPATLTVTANGVALAPVATGAAGQYQYSFVANANTTIAVSTPSLLQYTVALPTGENFTALFTGGTDENKTSVVKEYGENYSFKVEPVGNYTVKAVYVNGTEQTGASGAYGPFTVEGPQTISIVMEAIQFCTVTYVVDGAQLTTRQVQNGSPIPSVAAPTKEGYDFSGWYKDSAYNTALGTTTTAATDCEVYGRYVPKTYLIKYDLQSTSLTNPNPTSIPSTTKTFGQAVALSAEVPTATNYVFKGWAASENGPAVYQPGDTYSAESTANDSGVYQNVTLYAVWEIKTYHVTLVPGAGVTAYAADYEVAYGSDFDFTVIVERDYAATLPTVTVTPAPYTAAKQTGAPQNSAAATYTYKVDSVTDNLTINISATQNPERVVSFKYDLYKGTTDITDSPDDFTFDSQKVEHGYYAVRPATPVLEGYKFDGWYTKVGSVLTPYNFDTIVTSNITVYAKMTAIEPKVKLPADATANGWWISFSDTSNADTGAETATVAYKDEKTFYIFVANGYDATNMQVAANGYKLAPITDAADVDDGAGNIIGKLYTFTLYNITEDQTITVVGVVRKTVTITYNANARDDVSGMPVQQVVKYYLASDYDTIINQIPVRTGYTFLGWSTNSNATAADAKYTKALIETDDAIADFTKDTTLYAIWEAVGTTVALEIEGDYYNGNGARIDQFEGEQIKLIATITPSDDSTSVEGTVVFYYQPIRFIPGELEELERVTITSGNVAVVDVTVGQFYNETDSDNSGDKDWLETYWVEFIPKADEGFGKSVNSELECVRVWSKALAWATPGNLAIDANADVLKIYAADGTTSVDKMEANTVYWLEIPEVYPFNSPEMPKVGNDYQVVWEYLDPNNDWVELTTISNSDRLKVEAKYSQYSFRAKVYPTTNSIYTKAVEYDANGEIPANGSDVTYMDYLITEPTAAVVTKDTTTTLVIVNTDGKLTEAANVVINGANDVFAAEHLAQFEGDKITLKATVKETGTDAKVTTGTVKFYRYVNGTSDELLNIQDVALDSNGVATYTVEVDDYDTGKAVGGNIDQFYAVYKDLADDTTWTESNSKAALAKIYIKSTTIQTPVIKSDLPNANGDKATTYTADLTGLLAGVKHTFTLVVGANGQDAKDVAAAANWSVVALDGRTVDANDYTIKWYAEHIVDDNKTGDTDSGAIFVTTQNMMGDKFYVELIAQNNMDKGATSNKAIIGTKQDVKVTVTAKDDEEYQLSNVKLTAVVEAAETDATMQPGGTVTFYYTVKDNDLTDNTWTQVGVTTDLAVVAGAVTASIDTTELPVTASTNVKQDLVITAIYSGDDTFKPSAAIDSIKKIAVTTGCTVTNANVTIYSSVVHVTGIENTTDAGSTKADGIYIRIEGDKILANETNVNLMLSDIYTLDWNDTATSVVENWAKLAFGTDFTVQWQKLSNAAAYSSVYAAADTPWTNIEGATELTCQIAVEDGAAYRAVITTKDTPVAKGSYNKVDQGTVGTEDLKDGKKVYYSNILVASDAPATVTVNVNTSNVADGYEGIVEGETVTIHTFTSGATGTTPISELTMVITDEGGNEVDKQVKTNVNGHVSFDWAAAAPGYYTMTLTAKFTNGYSDKTIVRELIVRDNDYSFTTSGDGVAYNGKAQGLNVAVDGMGIESGLAQKSVVVYYYDKDGKQVEPTQAGTYTAKIRLQESAYWTEKTMDTTFTIAKRQLSIEDVIVQAKVYDGDVKANVQEIILKDAATNQTTGLPNVTTGVINGDSVYVTGTAVTNSADVKDATTVTVTAGELQGKDAANYELQVKTFSEAFKIQRSQVQGDIADATYKYGTTKVPAEDIYLIDQAGTVLDADDYTVTYYYHSGNGVKQVSAMNWKGMYTVIARPDQNNYKGGASQTVYVADAAVDADPVKDAKSALISITNTVELFGDANNKGIQATATKGTAVVKYNVGGAWVDTAPTAAGRYLVKVTAEENSAVIGTAYGLYTVVKTYPDYSIEAADADYNSAQYAASSITTNAPAGTYFTYTGGTIQGVAYEAPTEVGTYVVTAHIPESDNTVAHEFSDTFEIKPIALKITADSLQRRQYGAFPDMTASFDGLATGGVAADTSLRDVQIQPELIFNETDSYDNIAMDHVGNEYPIIAVAALARNYDVSYVNGNLSVTREEPNPYLAIHGMIDNGTNTENIAYYGDVIQLYAYGSQMGNVINNSSVLDWSVTGGPATISADGLLEITGVGTVVVTLKRGIGAQQISTTLTIDARKQEVKVEVPNVDLVYTGADRNYSGVGTPKAIDAKLTDVAVSYITVANNVRGVIGGQIVTGVVVDDKHQSETYGGLFTINDAEIVVAPKAVSTTYGTAATMSNVYNTGYTETTRVAGGTAALTGAVVASIADAYNNLDASTYEILVAGTEDMNYNVKYTTNPDAEVVTVTDLKNTLKYTTGVIAGSTGRTSGSVIDASGFNPDEGAVVTYADPTVEPNDRMYGEPNPAMNYLFNGLIAGDSAADLVKLIELVGFVPGIDKEANVAFTDAHISASGVATGKSGTYLSGKSYYETTTALPVNGVKNYLMENTDITLGIQNVYQRPFTLKLTGNKTELRVYKPLVINSSTVDKAKLLEIILDNMEVVEYESGGKKYGGLATKLGHTINDVNLEIVSAIYDSVAGTINVELKCNDNYWLSNKNWTIVVDPSMITVSYGTLGKYSSSVTMYGIDEDGNNIGATDVTGKVWYEIYVEDTSLQRKYSNYKDLTPVVRVQMTKGNGTGVYVANYNSTPLSAGHYVMFAIAEDYTIIE